MPIKRTLIMALLTALLTACGHMGPLYLPPADHPPDQTVISSEES